MAIDTSIYGLVKPIEAPSMLDSMHKASTLKSLAMQQGRMGQEMEAERMQAHLQKAAAFGDAMEGLAKVPEAQRPQAYAQMYKQLSQAGIVSPDQAPPEYDPSFHAATVERYKQTKPYLEKQLAAGQVKLQESQLALQKSQAFENYAQANAAKAKQNPAKIAYDTLPPENQKQIDTLATKTATKSSVKNQIDSALTILDDPKVSETQKVVIGQQLLKTLNSTEGADAVGAEESKRLGSLLEKKFFNVMQPGSMFGRDLGEFVNQVKLTSGSIGQALERNKAEIDKLYGRSGSGVNPIDVPRTAQRSGGSLPGVKDAYAAPPPPKHGTVVDGFVFMGGDPADQKNWKRR